MYYAGESNVPGAPGNLLPGSPFVPYAANRHRHLQQIAANGPTMIRLPQPNGSVPMGNAGFFYGPQLGQSVPAGYANKTVS